MKNCSFALAQMESSAPAKDFTKDQDGHITCNKCPKKFTMMRNFYRHNNDIHLNPKPKRMKKSSHECVV